MKAATRERVLQVAADMGYVVNAAASLMAQQRGALSREGLAVGFLNDGKWSEDFFFKQCSELGLMGRVFRPSEFASPEAASRLLWNQGISGLLVSAYQLTWSESDRARFDWSKFSLVKNSRSLPDLPCHLMRHSAFDYMAMTLGKVVERGFRRIAVVLMPSTSSQDDDARHGALLNFKERKLPPGVTLEFTETSVSEPELVDHPVNDWLQAYKPDAIVGYHWTMIYGLRKLGWRIPEEVGFAAVLLDDRAAPDTAIVSGCLVRSDLLRRRALELLQRLIGRGERGFPQNPMEHVVKPVWSEGETLGAKSG